MFSEILGMNQDLYLLIDTLLMNAYTCMYQFGVKEIIVWIWTFAHVFMYVCLEKLSGQGNKMYTF